MKRTWFAVAVVALAFASGWVSRCPGPPPPTAPPLPAKVVEVERVKTIEVRGQPYPVPGPVQIVERVVFQTPVVDVPEPVIREVVKVVEKAAELGSLQGWVETRADKFEGVKDGELRWGWAGSSSCRIRALPTDPWTDLVTSPLDLSSSTAISTIVPRGTTRRWTLDLRAGLTSAPGWDAGASWHGKGRIGAYLGAQGDLDPEQVYVPETESYATLDRYRVYGGLSLRIGPR